MSRIIPQAARIPGPNAAVPPQWVWPSRQSSLSSSAGSLNVTVSVVASPSPTLLLVKPKSPARDRLRLARPVGRPRLDQIAPTPPCAPPRPLIQRRSFTTTSLDHPPFCLHRTLDPDLLRLSPSRLLSKPNVRRVGSPLPKGSMKRLMQGNQSTSPFHLRCLHSPLSRPPRVRQQVRLVLSAFHHQYHSRITSANFMEAIRLPWPLKEIYQ